MSVWRWCLLILAAPFLLALIIYLDVTVKDPKDTWWGPIE